MAFFSPGVIIGAMGSISGQIDEAREENKKLAEDYKKKAEAAFAEVKEQAKARKVSDQEFMSVTERVMSQTKAGKASLAKMTPYQKIQAGKEISKTQKNNPSAPPYVLAHKIVTAYNKYPSIYGKVSETPEGTQGIPKKESTFTDRFKSALVGSPSQEDTVRNMVPESMQQPVLAAMRGQDASPRGTAGPGAGLNRLGIFMSAKEKKDVLDNAILTIANNENLGVSRDQDGGFIISKDDLKSKPEAQEKIQGIMMLRALDAPLTRRDIENITSISEYLAKKSKGDLGNIDDNILQALRSSTILDYIEKNPLPTKDSSSQAEEFLTNEQAEELLDKALDANTQTITIDNKKYTREFVDGSNEIGWKLVQ